jgi:hypothetical protein
MHVWVSLGVERSRPTAVLSLLENGILNCRGPWLELDHIKVRYGPACIGEYLITTHCVEGKPTNDVAMAKKSRIASSRQQCCDE